MLLSDELYSENRSVVNLFMPRHGSFCRVLLRFPMKKFVLAAAMLLVAVLTSNTASAQQPGPYGFLPYGFYQPYGAQYGSSIRKPPYFATNPPVYYGARHSRPYGLSPFASPPMVVARDDYRSRLRLQFSQPRVPTPAPLCNPHCDGVDAPMVEEIETPEPESATEPVLGAVRINPFVQSADRLANK